MRNFNSDVHRIDEATKNYFNALLEVHKVLGYTDKFPLSAILTEYGIPTAGISILSDGGIIEFTGHRTDRVYKWKGPRPNIKMAEEFKQRVSEYSYKSKKRKQKKVTKISEVAQTKNNEIDTITLKILWGAINLTFKVNYK